MPTLPCRVDNVATDCVSELQRAIGTFQSGAFERATALFVLLDELAFVVSVLDTLSLTMTKAKATGLIASFQRSSGLIENVIPSDLCVCIIDVCTAMRGLAAAFTVEWEGIKAGTLPTLARIHAYATARGVPPSSHVDIMALALQSLGSVECNGDKAAYIVLAHAITAVNERPSIPRRGVTITVTPAGTASASAATRTAFAALFASIDAITAAASSRVDGDSMDCTDTSGAMNMHDMQAALDHALAQSAATTARDADVIARLQAENYGHAATAATLGEQVAALEAEHSGDSDLRDQLLFHARTNAASATCSAEQLSVVTDLNANLVDSVRDYSERLEESAVSNTRTARMLQIEEAKNEALRRAIDCMTAERDAAVLSHAVPPNDTNVGRGDVSLKRSQPEAGSTGSFLLLENGPKKQAVPVEISGRPPPPIATALIKPE